MKNERAAGRGFWEWIAYELYRSDQTGHVVPLGALYYPVIAAPVPAKDEPGYVDDPHIVVPSPIKPQRQDRIWKSKVHKLCRKYGLLIWQADRIVEFLNDDTITSVLNETRLSHEAKMKFLGELGEIRRGGEDK